MLFGTTRMSGDNVIGQVLFQPMGLAFKLKGFFKRQKRIGARFVHFIEHFFLGMFRRKFELAGNVMATEFVNIFAAMHLVCHDHVVTNARAHKDPSHTRNFANFP